MATNTRRARGAMLALVAAMSLETAGSVWAQGQPVTVSAEPYTLGTIPPPSGISCGERTMLFYVGGVDVVQSLTIEMNLSLGALRAHGASLQSPDNRIVDLFEPYTSSYLNPLDGSYTFTDRASSSWLSSVPGSSSISVPSGFYRALDGTTEISLDAAFGGAEGSGVWRLSVYNCASAVTGLVSSATLSLYGTGGVVVTATAGLGAIPDGPSVLAQTPGQPRDVTFVVPPGRRTVTHVTVSVSLSHTWVGDLVAQLIAPTGESHVLFGYTGATSAISKGSRADLAYQYTFHDRAGRSWWSTALAVGTGIVPDGAYRTSGTGGLGATGLPTPMDAAFVGVPSAGTWTLRLTDGSAGDTGSVSGATLSLETLMIPDAVDDAYTTTYLQTVGRPAPGVLSNDATNGATAVVVELVTGPSRGTLTLQPSGAFSYTPRLGFVGTDTFQYRAVSALGAGRTATATIRVQPPSVLEAPFDLIAETVVGRDVTLRWKTAPGPSPTDFVLEGGVLPGQTVGSMAIPGPVPVLTFTAPPGVFFVRVRAVAGGIVGPPSNEIRIVVGVAEVPSAPGPLAGVVNGDILGLSWRSTFTGGAPDDFELLVSGGATAALPVPVGEALNLGGVPPGTYTFRLRARNGAGAGAVSNPVTLTFPGACSGPPLAPQNPLVFAAGNVVQAYWDPPASGPAATNYLLQVSGSFTGVVPVTARTLRAPAPPGSYAIAVAAQNACGTSAFTAPQTAFVR